jgi:hypothetical protein
MMVPANSFFQIAVSGPENAAFLELFIWLFEDLMERDLGSSQTCDE